MGRSVVTDAKGRYQMRVGPGTYALQVPNENLSSDQVTDVYETTKENPSVRTYHREIVVGTITVKDEAEVTHDLWIPKPQTGPISGRVVFAGDPSRGIAGAKVQGIAMPPGWKPTITDSDGRFLAQRKLEKTVVHARSPDGSLAGLIEIRDDDREVVIPVGPTATVTGIILDERGNPVVNVQVSSERRIGDADGREHFGERFTPTALTDERGRFTLTELLVGQEYEISVPAEKNSWFIAAWVKPQEAGRAELGTLKVGAGLASMLSFRAGKPAAGDPAPGFEAKTLDGRSIKLEDFRGKYVLLDFWTTSCEPCADEISRLQAIHDSFGRGERLVILGLSLDETIEIPRQFQEKRKLPGMQGFLGKGIDGAVPDRYGVRAVPAFVLVGPDGKIVAKGMRGAGDPGSGRPGAEGKLTRIPLRRSGPCPDHQRFPTARAGPRPSGVPRGTGPRRRPCPGGRSPRRRGWRAGCRRLLERRAGPAFLDGGTVDGQPICQPRLRANTATSSTVGPLLWSPIKTKSLLLAAKRSAAAWTSGSSAMHGPQLIPQKSTSTTLPARSGAWPGRSGRTRLAGRIGGAGWPIFSTGSIERYRGTPSRRHRRSHRPPGNVRFPCSGDARSSRPSTISVPAGTASTKSRGPGR